MKPKGGRQKVAKRSPLQLGDAVKSALEMLGVTEERVSRFLGRPCGCRRRRDRLNRLSDWAYSLVAGGKPVSEARTELDTIVDGPEPVRITSRRQDRSGPHPDRAPQ